MYWIGEALRVRRARDPRERRAARGRDLRLLLAERAARVQAGRGAEAAEALPAGPPPLRQGRPGGVAHVRRRRHAARRVRARSGARSCRSSACRSGSSTRSSRSRITTSSSTAGCTSRASRARCGPTSPRGDFAQGGSTITQQVAKQFLGAEKSLARKGKEAIVARRLEATYSKQRDPRRSTSTTSTSAPARGASRAAAQPLLPEGPRPAHARRVRADRRARQGADRVLADPPPEARDRAPQRRARQDGGATASRRRGRGRGREAGADHARRLSRRVPRSHAVLRRARARATSSERYGASARRALRAGLRDRDRGRADVGGRRVREHRFRRAPPGQAPGLARPRVARSTARRARLFIERQTQLYGAGAARAGQALPRARRQGRRRAAPRC